MYAIHRQVHRPTGIEQSLYCNFYSGNEKNLVVTGVNQLHVYRLNSDIEVRNLCYFFSSIHLHEMDSIEMYMIASVCNIQKNLTVSH